jgi:hypothetical protein
MKNSCPSIYTKPKRVKAIRDWFFDERKLNMFKYTAL